MAEDDKNAQYDYAYDNSEIVSEDEKKKLILHHMKGVMYHVAHRFTDAGYIMAKGAPIPNTFNDKLAMPNYMERSRFSPQQARQTVRRTRRVNRPLNSRLYSNRQ